ncbi:MAG: hypothetical protein ACK4WH_01620 [Phycisphaerales bacterium]
MNPLYSVDATTSQVAVTGFLALANSGTTFATNLVAVWYVNTPGGWITKSWASSDPWVDIKAVKLELGISGLEDERWSIPGDGSHVAQIEQPVDYVKGLLSFDPLASLVAVSPDREFLIQVLTSVGYPAADVPVDKGDDCAADNRLNTLATEVHAHLTTLESAVILLMGSALLPCEVVAQPAIAPRPAAPTSVPYPNPPGTVPGGPPPGPSWVPGAWSTFTCRSVLLLGGAQNCICTRSRRWG